MLFDRARGSVPLMAHYLYLGSQSDPLKLDESTNIDKLKEDLEKAAKAGEVSGLNAFVSNSDEPDWVNVNLSVVPWWTVAWRDDKVQAFGR